MSEHDATAAFDRYRDGVEQPIVRLFRTYGGEKVHWCVVGVLANLLGWGASLLPALVLGAAIDGLLTSDAGLSVPLVPQSVVPAGRIPQLEFAVALIAGSFVASAAFTWLWGVTMNAWAHHVQHVVRVDAFETLQRLDMAFFDDEQTGEVMSVLHNDVANLARFLDDALSDLLRITLLVAWITVVLAAINWQLAAVSLGAVPLLAAFTWGFVRLAEPRYRALRAAVGDFNARIENSLDGTELVKTSAAGEYEIERVTASSRALYERRMDVRRLRSFYRPGTELVAGVSLAATFLLGGYWVIGGPPFGLTGTLTVGEFVIFIALIHRLVEPLSSLSDVVNGYEDAKASSERIFGLMDAQATITDAPYAVDVGDADGDVTFQDVTFSYDDETTLLDEVTFEAEAGETVALVGPTGAGKSTIVKLLLRLYDVDRGAVRIDGTDVRNVRLDSLRESIGYVSQDTFLFDESIAGNIRYGECDASRAEVIAAAKAAEADGFITDLPDGYDTRVGERGVKLSGGQRQRIALARLFLRNPDLVVLDEATSAVDTQTEVSIQRSLERLSADRTTFIVAHRLSTVTNADTILVLDDGEIVERGDHESLVERDGLYATLWRAQSGDLDEVDADEEKHLVGMRHLN
jgi:ATP-binding cassette subfamily B protein